MGYIGTFSGTPFKGVIWRLLGAKVGRRLFDDGCWMTERSLVTIGDHCTLGATSTIQAHSLEDGAFKSDHIVIGSHSTLATHAFVHYGVTMGESSVLALDSFLMKGETMAPGDTWLGNPARPPHAVIPEASTEPEGYLGQLLRQISALESKIDRLAQHGRPSRGRSGALVAASLALLATAGTITINTHPALASALPAAWNTLLTGVTPGAGAPAPTPAKTSSRPRPTQTAQAESPHPGVSDDSGTSDPDTSETPDASPPVQGFTHLQLRGKPSTPRAIAPPGFPQPLAPPGAPVTSTRGLSSTRGKPTLPPPDVATPPTKPEAKAEVEEATARLKQAKAALKQAKAAGESAKKKTR
jgi:hypothetical protein